MEMQLFKLTYQCFYTDYTTRLNICGCELSVRGMFALIFTHSFNHIQILFRDQLLWEIKNLKEHLISKAV